MRIKSPASRFTFYASLFLILFLFLIAPKTHAYSRIVSTKPNITEILFALGVGDKMVGVTTYCTRPPEAQKLPKVADYINVFPEIILRLQPDLVLGSEENGSQKEIHFLMDRGFQVKLFPFSTIEETMQSIQGIGDLVGKEEVAKALVQKMKQELEHLKKEASGVTKKKILFVVGYQPLIVAGGNNFFDEATEYIGATNVARESHLKYPTYTTELLIRSAPEVILDLAMGSEKSESDQKAKEGWWKQFHSIPAVQRNQIYTFDIEKMRAVPSLPATLREIYERIHPALK